MVTAPFLQNKRLVTKHGYTIKTDILKQELISQQDYEISNIENFDKNELEMEYKI